MRPRLHFLLWLLVLSIAGTAFAAETGSVSGSVRDKDGSALPGVSVTVSGDPLPAGRTEATDENGGFDFQRLPPGEYQITAELQGMGNARRAVVVQVDKDTQVALTIGPSVSEEITVTAATPVIDVKSTEAQVNFTQEQIESLPIPRDYKGTFQLAPGVAENDHLAPNAGGSRQDNTFLLDGVNITNPHYGDLVPNVPEIDIAEVNIKRAGVTAEFGRTGGMVVNAVTHSGTNELNGQARFESQPSSFVSDSKDKTLQNTIDRRSLAASLGGPILRDRLWYYGSASFPERNTTDRRNNLGDVPDRELSTDEYFLKLTSNPSSAHFLNASVRSRKTTDKNAGIDSNISPNVGSTGSTDYLIGNFGWTWNTTADSFFEVRYNHDKEENSTDPITSLGYRPAFDPAHPEQMGRFTTTADRIVGGANAIGQIVGGLDLAVNDDDFLRDEVRATFQSFQGWLGREHDLRAGVIAERDSERLSRRANGWGNVTWNATTKEFTASYVSTQPPHTGRGRNYGAFLQDQVSLGSRATLTAGLRLDRDDYFGEALGATPGTKRKVKLISFGWGDEIQPRLGLSFVPSVRTGDKLYFNYGRYYNTENKSLVRAASPTRIFTTRAIFDAQGHLKTETPAANTTGKLIDPGLDAQYTDEWLAGYARPLGNVWSAEVWAVYRDVGNMLEDVSADGLGNGPFRIAQLPDAYRRYKAATLELQRRPNDGRLMNLSVDASYTWSRLSGNWDIDYGADSLFYNSSFIQDGPGVLLTDNRAGLLRGDRTHVAKIFASVEPWQRTRFGTYLRFQSGGAWEARGLPDPNVSSSSYVRYLEKAGSRRMEDWLNLDLLASHTFAVGPVGLELEARVLNVFDKQVALSVDDRLILGRATAPNNPKFGQPTSYSSPRAFALAAILRY